MLDALYYNHREGADLVCEALERAIQRLRKELQTYEALSPLLEDPEGLKAVDKLLEIKEGETERRVEKNRGRGNAYIAHVAKRIREVHELKQAFGQDIAPDTVSVQKARMIIHNCMLYEATQLMDSYEDENSRPDDPDVKWSGQSMLLYAKAMNSAFADFPGDTWSLYPLDHPTSAT
jgi:hypothetical protein